LRTLRRAAPIVAATLLTLCLLLSGTAGALAQAQGPAGGPQSDVASYQIQVTLDPQSKQLHGSERITYRNPSPNALGELWFHLYLNAFRSPDTQWLQESGGGHRGFAAEEPGWIKVESLALAGGQPLSLPDGGDTPDTIARVALPQPLGPGQTLTLDATWTSQLPRVFARTGFAGDFFMVGQWYPKLAVYDRGQWDSEPWHANSEFFADFGNYDLAITLPQPYVTGASGVRQGEKANSDGSKTVSYRAERVTDVAWTAWPQYQAIARQVQAAGQSTAVELLLPASEAGDAERHLAAIRAALDAYGSWYGPYPWPKLTVVVPPEDAGGAGGMEYPTLVTTGSNGPTRGLPGVDQGIYSLETVTVHEIAHEWFPMQVQSNEAAEAWLDEGFADYLTTRVLGRLYGPDRSVLNLPLVRLGYVNQQRGVVGSLGVAREPLAQASWQFDSPNTYAATVYAKGSLSLLSLENYYGDERFTAALRHYADVWRWRHPTSADLRDALGAALGENLDWFFNSFVFGRDTVDYQVDSLTASQATVSRVGEARYPVDLRLDYSDGSSRNQRWDGQQQSLTVSGEGKAVVGLAVDPEQSIALEINRWDNTRLEQPSLAPALTLADRWLAFVQLLLQLVGQVG
jgi:hypothetical protein